MNQAQEAFPDPTQILEPEASIKPAGLVFPTDPDATMDGTPLEDGGKPRVGPDDPSKGGMYRRLNLTDEEKEFVVYSQYEAMSLDISDTLHDPNYPWVDQFTATPGWLQEVAARMSVDTGDGYQMLDVDHSYVITLHGKPAGEYGIAQDGTIMTRTEAEDRMVATGRRNIPLFVKWDFRVVEAVMTDGFEARRRLVESTDQRMKEEQAGTFTALKNMFQTVLQDNQKDGAKNIADVKQGIPTGEDLAEILANLEPEQLAGAMEMASDIRESNNPEPESEPEKKTTTSRSKAK